jgi:hypothetical protein
MRNTCQAIISFVVLAGLQSVAHAQDIIAVPVGKQPPALCFGGAGTQVNVYNITRQPERLRLRNPGGNWQVFTLPPNGGLQFCCKVCSNELESRLLGEGESVTGLVPGTTYEIGYSDGQRLELRPRGAR